MESSFVDKYVSILREMGTPPARGHFSQGLYRRGDPVFRQQTPKCLDATPTPQVAAGIEAILFDTPREVFQLAVH